MALHLETPLTAAPLVFFDVETTGLLPREGDRVCELALLRCVGHEEWAWSTLLDPQRPLSASAFAVNGISAESLAGAPRFAAVAATMLALMEGGLLLAHNAAFDVMFLNNELALSGAEPLRQQVVDTLAVSRRLLPRRPSHSLAALAQSLGIERPTHRALDDVRVLRGVFAAMTDMLGERGVTTVGALLRYQRGLLPDDPEPELPESIAVALQERRRLRLVYAGVSGSGITEREIDPIALTSERGVPCLQAFCYLRNDVRTFVITRIVRIDLV